MKRFTYEFVKEQFEKEGYKLLSKKYRGSKNKLRYICPKKHIHSISFANFQQGQRCKYCAIKYNSMARKISLGYIRKEFEKENYVLLSTEYKYAKEKLNYICSVGHEHQISWNHWKSGKRCPYCAAIIRGKNRRLDFDVIKASFEAEGYKLLSTEYKNCSQKLEYICIEGHKHSISWEHWFYSGNRCAVCANIRNSGIGNCNWKGGISCEPYCDAWADKEYKKSILERDNYTCQNPNCWGTIKDLTIHHIDYDKQNCHPTNIITLCRSCNSRANYNREWHKDFYRIIIKKKYNFKGV